MKATRIAHSCKLTASKLSRLGEIARRLGVLRSNVWQEYGSLKGVGVKHREIRDWWLAESREFNVPARLWKETLRATFSDIVMYREAAKFHVRKAIHKRFPGKKDPERKRLYTLLKRDDWKEDSFLRRLMRKHFKHGKTSVRNQIVLDTGCYKTFSHGGKAWVSVMSLKRGKRIAIPLNTTREPTGTLRLILRDARVEVHYTVEAEDECSTKPCGKGKRGVDKGYTEVFVDSEGDHYGEGFGHLLSNESDYLKEKYRKRNKLKAIAEAKPHKREAIEANNLGRQKLNKRKQKHTDHVRDHVFKATHALIDNTNEVVSEDLTKQIKSKKVRSKNMKRRLSSWVKGLIAVALQSVSQRRGATLHLVSASYTSQIDHRHGILLGERRGDRFYCFDGEVFQADHNAAQNVLARHGDKEISLWTPYTKVKSILLKRTELFRLGLLNQDSSCALVPF